MEYSPSLVRFLAPSGTFSETFSERSGVDSPTARSRFDPEDALRPESFFLFRKLAD